MSQSSAAGKCSDTTSSPNSQHLSIKDLDERSRLLGVLFYTMRHLFGDIRGLFSSITDPRDQKKIVYPIGDLALAGILMFMCGLKARRQIALLMRYCAGTDTLDEFFQAGKCPHGDTLKDAFAVMDPTEFQNIICWMVYCLIRKKILYSSRLLEAWRNAHLTGGMLQWITQWRFQIRFCPDTS